MSASSLSRRVARLEGFAPYSGDELQLICIHGGTPTASGGPEADVGDSVLVREPGEDVEDFKQRAVTEGRLIGARFVVIHGLPPRDVAIGFDNPISQRQTDG